MPQPGLDVMPSGPLPANSGERLAGPRLAEFLGWAETNYDQILLDSPSLLSGTDFPSIGQLVEGALLVIGPNNNRGKQLLKSAEILNATNAAFWGIVANRLTSKPEPSDFETLPAFDPWQ